MKYIYFKHELEDLTQGSRIAFIRQFRGLTQEKVGEKLGLNDENRRKGMTRYESGERTPKEDRLLEIANILSVNVNCIRKYTFNKTEDIVYFLLWLEELYPKMSIDFAISEYFRDDRDNLILKFMDEWKCMRNLRDTRELSYEKYLEWKLNYVVKEGE